MLLRYIEKATLQKSTKTKQANGTYIETVETIGKYNVQTQELSDEVSASIYGADIFKIVRIRSTDQSLEKYLYDKVNNKADNISFYKIVFNDRTYKIKTVNQKGIDLELI